MKKVLLIGLLALSLCGCNQDSSTGDLEITDINSVGSTIYFHVLLVSVLVDKSLLRAHVVVACQDIIDIVGELI